MSERWVRECETIVKQIREALQKAPKDRLEAVRLMRFTLYALHRSVLGWLGWVNNPDVMSEFSKEEIEDMNKFLSNFTEDFIEYDAKITTKGSEKSLAPKKRKGRETEGLYV